MYLAYIIRFRSKKESKIVPLYFETKNQCEERRAEGPETVLLLTSLYLATSALTLTLNT